MKRLGKILALILALAMFLTVLTACDKESGTIGGTMDLDGIGDMDLDFSDIETYDDVQQNEIKIDFDPIDLELDEIEVYDDVEGRKIDLDSIDEIKLELRDNISSVEMAKIAEIPQEKLELVLEKKENLLADLKNEFGKHGIDVSINEESGDVTLDAAILFDNDQAAVSQEGKEFLTAFLPVYASVIFDDKYDGFVSQIIVEGHTDTNGSYDYNLNLSKKRADNVKAFCISSQSGVDSQYLSSLKMMLTAEGYSYDRPVKDQDGKVDMAASRRVSFKFLINLE